MDEFLNSFWPNLASTVIGVVVGVPFALWINASGSRSQRDAEQRADAALLKRSIEAILSSLAHNKPRFFDLAAVIEDNKIVYQTGLDQVGWNVTRDHIVRLLPNPELVRQIAFHFSEIQQLERLADLYRDMGVGVASVTTGSSKVRETIRPFICTKARALIQDSESLSNHLSTTLSELPANAS